jgi:hypothetical protein
MKFEPNKELAARRLNFRRVGELLKRGCYIHDSRCEVPRLVAWIREIIRDKGEKFVHSNRDRLVHAWMNERRFSYGLDGKERIQIARKLWKEGRRYPAEKYFPGIRKLMKRG